MIKKKKMPRDINALAKRLVDLSTGNASPIEEEDGKPQKNPAAVALGRLGGLKGGPARAAKLSPERRKEIAKKAVTARWKKEK